MVYSCVGLVDRTSRPISIETNIKNLYDVNGWVIETVTIGIHRCLSSLQVRCHWMLFIQPGREMAMIHKLRQCLRYRHLTLSSGINFHCEGIHCQN